MHRPGRTVGSISKSHCSTHCRVFTVVWNEVLFCSFRNLLHFPNYLPRLCWLYFIIPLCFSYMYCTEPARRRLEQREFMQGSHVWLTCSKWVWGMPASWLSLLTKHHLVRPSACLFSAPPCATHNEMNISNQLSLIKVTTQSKLFASLLLRAHFIRSLSIVIK